MIIKLDNFSEDMAGQIFTIFQRSYKIEAQLIGAADFPPLSRSAQDIEKSKSQFYGFIDNKCLAATIEIAIEDRRLEINSLTVDPDYFRKGIAGKLLSYILDEFEFIEAIVETAAVNEPAINLYKKYGFVEFKQWIPPHGTKKVALSLKNAL
ncbi:GNAT family N-acetyltransferase [Microbulbifer sp. JMSA003]|uniref:GNAT family N-acetyltransferase n=1 Tax=Microbulbifer sp. JMSA003 TaxID=3243369 RepID=UPI004039B6E0